MKYLRLNQIIDSKQIKSSQKTYIQYYLQKINTKQIKHVSYIEWKPINMVNEMLMF
jgi:hypothetical protein